MIETGGDNLFRTMTPLGFEVRVTNAQWEVIAQIKHPVMRNKEELVRKALTEPEEVRRSRRDKSVFLFYTLERQGRWICAVAKQQNEEGFLITAYPTDAIKEGDRVWNK
jgi:hypothetical protein